MADMAELLYNLQIRDSESGLTKLLSDPKEELDFQEDAL